MTTFTRRDFLYTSLGAGALVAGSVIAGCSSNAPSASGKSHQSAGLSWQLDWYPDNAQAGETVASRKGWFSSDGIKLSISPGGPNVQGIPLVASGKALVGQISSSPSLMLAISQGTELQAFGTSLQKHPYAFFSLPKNPVHTPHDLIGKTVGIQATGVVLLDALLAKNNIDKSELKVVTIGGDASPLAAGRVDVVTGWLTDVAALKPIGSDYVAMTLWDAGVRLYANVFYAKTETIRTQKDLLASFLEAAGRGWEFTKNNPTVAIDMLISQYPNLDKAAEAAGLQRLLGYAFTPATRSGGWATMDPSVWKDQIDLYAKLGQFKGATPRLDDVMTMSVLDASAAKRPQIG